MRLELRICNRNLTLKWTESWTRGNNREGMHRNKRKPCKKEYASCNNCYKISMDNFRTKEKIMILWGTKTIS